MNSQRNLGNVEFCYGRNGTSLLNRLHAMVRHYLSGHATSVDPNWCRVEIRFDDYFDLHEFSNRKPDAPNAYLLEIDYRPSRVELVCPKLGHVDWTDKFFAMVPEELYALMHTASSILYGNRISHVIGNPKHEVELIGGRTVVVFENTEDGVVRNVQGDHFDVEDLHNDEPVIMRSMTRRQLLDEFKMEEMACQAVYVDYLPDLPWEGLPMDTPENIRASRKELNEKALRRSDEERARRESEEAAAYAALSPEERAKVDERNARLRAQVEETRGILEAVPIVLG